MRILRFILVAQISRGDANTLLRKEHESTTHSVRAAVKVSIFVGISDKVKHEYMTSSRDQLKDILKVNFKQEDFICHYYSGIATAQQKNR